MNSNHCAMYTEWEESRAQAHRVKQTWICTNRLQGALLAYAHFFSRTKSL